MDSIQYKECRDCGEARPVSDFYKKPGSRDGYGYRCKGCEKIYQRARYDRNRGKAQKARSNPAAVKRCRECGKSKSLSEYRDKPNSKDGIDTRCISCEGEYQARYYEENAAATKERVARWRLENPDKYASLRGRFNSGDAKKVHRLKSEYGLSLDQYAEMLDRAGGACEICGRDPYEVSSHGPCIDHCHESSKVRGILCYSCNVAIGHFRDDSNVLRKAIEYLETHAPVAVI